MRDEVNISEQDDLIVAVSLVEGGAQNFSRVLPVAIEPFLVRASYADRCAKQARTFRVFADPEQESADCGFSFLPRGPGSVPRLTRRISLHHLPQRFCCFRVVRLTRLQRRSRRAEWRVDCG